MTLSSIRSFSSSSLTGGIAILTLISSLAGGMASGQSRVPGTKPAGIAASYNKLPLQFEANRGQAGGSANFVAHGQGYSILLRPDAAVFALHRNDPTPAAGQPATVARSARGEVIRMGLMGASATAAISAEGQLPGYVNYLHGSDQSKWQIGIPTYARTRVTGIYPGVDVVYYGSQRRLEYDFVLAPGANSDKIRLMLSGAKPVLAADGSLILQRGKKHDASDLRFEQPVLYQDSNGRRVPVDGAFQIAKNGEIGFRVGAYDHTRELVIDPIISYASYFGGTGEDEINGSALNSSGQLYAVGQTYSTNLPGTTAEFQPTDIPNTTNATGGNGHDGFVTKFSADGTAVLWTTYLGGSLETRMNAVALGSTDNAYVTGQTGSTGSTYFQSGATYNIIDYPVTANAFQPISCPGGDGYGDGTSTKEVSNTCPTSFVTELSSDGKSLVYSTFLGSDRNYDDQGLAIAVDTTGNIYVAGHTYATDYVKCAHAGDPHCQSIPQSTYPVGGYAAPFGTTDFPTTPNAYAPAYAVAQKSALAAGPDANGNYSYGSYEMAFLSVFNAAGTMTYSTIIGGGKTSNPTTGVGPQQATTVAPGKNGIVYVGGVTSSTQFPTTSGAFQPACVTYNGDQCYQQGWLAAFDTTKSGAASLVFSTYMNGTVDGANYAGTAILPTSQVTAATTDSSGNVVVTGLTNACNYPTTAGTVGAASKPHGDGNGDTNVCAIQGFITKLTPAGATVWSTYIEGTGNGTGNGTQPAGIALDTTGNVYVIATADDSTLPMVNSIYGYNGGGDGYLIEVSPTATQVLLGTFIGTLAGPNLDNNSLHLDANATAYISGSALCGGYGCTTIPATTGAFQTSSAGGSADGYVMKIITQLQPSATALAVTPTGGVAMPTQTVTLTATVTTSSTLTGKILPAGIVTFLNGSTTIGTGTLNASGVATYTGMLAAGTYNITASYAGNSGFTGSVSTSSALSVSTATLTTTALTVSPASSAYAAGSTLTATVLAGTAPATSGTVTFTAGTMTLGSATVSALGVATVTAKPVVGMYSVIASYAGTYNQTSNPTGYGSSTSAGVALTVTKATTTTTQTTSTTNANLGTAFTLTATVPTGATGTVSFYSGTTLLGTGTVNANGVATLSPTISTAGSYNITSVYSGDANYSGSTSSVTVEVVKTPTTVTAASSTASAGTGSSITLTATLPAGATGTVSFYNGTTLLGTGTVGANGVATLVTALTTAGTYTVSSVYPGDGNYYGSTSTATAQIVVVTPGFTVTTNPASLTITRGSTGVVTLTTTPVGGFTGVVTFTCGTLPSKATCTFSPATITLGGAAVPDTLTIGTGSASASLTAPRLFRTNDAVYAGIFLGLLGLARRRKLTRITGLLLAMFSLAAVTALTGCGSSFNGSNETPAGSYTITVTGSGTSAAAQTVNLTVLVQ